MSNLSPKKTYSHNSQRCLTKIIFGTLTAKGLVTPKKGVGSFMASRKEHEGTNNGEDKVRLIWLKYNQSR